jgi:squalene-hopene/tetraprenyl-beta-curcumene cyclase
VEETAWAARALLAAAEPDSGDAVARGIQWLLEAQGTDGSWPSSRVCVYVRHLMHYPNGAITAGLALRALGAAAQVATGTGR